MILSSFCIRPCAVFPRRTGIFMRRGPAECRARREKGAAGAPLTDLRILSSLFSIFLRSKRWPAAFKKHAKITNYRHEKYAGRERTESTAHDKPANAETPPAKCGRRFRKCAVVSRTGKIRRASGRSKERLSGYKSVRAATRASERGRFEEHPDGQRSVRAAKGAGGRRSGPFSRPGRRP